jgi:Methyltransferase domain
MQLRQLAYRKKRSFQHWLKVLFVRMRWHRHHLPVINLNQVVPQQIRLELPILDHICLPPYHTPNDHNDFIPVMSIARHIQPRLIVELGTAYGNLTANLCRELPSTKILTVNAPLEEQTGEKVTYQLTAEDIGRVYREHGYSRQVIQIFRNTLTLELGEYLEKRSVELAIIDACHDREYVLNDFLKVAPFVRPNGIVLLHDTHPNMTGHLLGSYWACLQLREKGYDIKHLAESWWGIWVNKKER